MKKFKVAIDVSPLNDGNSVRGVGYYTRNLVSALQQEVKTNSDFKHYQIDLISNSSLDINNYSLVHYPYFDPFKLTLPKTKIPYIVTCHDLIPIAFKRHFPVGLKGELKWLIQKHRLEKSAFIICPSFAAKYQISEYLKYPSNNIFVTYEAATPDFKKYTDPQVLKEIKDKYQLPDKFVLFVGDINWNKNIPKLVKACLKTKYPLVIVGQAATQKVIDHPWTKDILWLQSQKSSLIHLLGFVPNEDLPIIYNLAKIYCQPSFSEGFGLPLLQAMQSGTPICYSNKSSLPEIMDFNGESFNPYSQKNLVHSLKKLWTNKKLQEKYSQGGLKRAEIFDWKYTALQTLALYRLIELDEKK